jgi:hypothetical protein
MSHVEALGSKCQDRYGFPQAALSAAEQYCLEEALLKESKNIDRWAKLQARHWQPTASAEPPAKLKQLAREGIPHTLRPQLWLRYSGAAALQHAEPAHYYESLVAANRRGSSKLGVTQLDADLFRTFPQHPVLSSSTGIHAVRRVVTAFGRRNPEMPYAKSVNAIVAFLFAVLGLHREEEVFWILVALLEQRLQPNCVMEDARGFNVEQRVFEDLVAQKFPKLAEVFDKLECSLSSLTSGWLRTLYTTALPAETVARVWDCMMVEGPKVLFRVGLALMKMNEPALMSTCHSIQVARILKWRVSRTYQVGALFKHTFKGVGSIKTELVVKTRAAQTMALKAELAAHKKRLEDILGTNTMDRTGVAVNNPLAKALGQVKLPSQPMAITGGRSHLSTIMESPIEFEVYG